MSIIRRTTSSAAVREGGSDDGTIVWEIVEAAAADGGEEDGTILWEIVEAADGGEEDGTILWEILEAELRVNPKLLAHRPGRDPNHVARLASRIARAGLR